MLRAHLPTLLLVHTAAAKNQRNWIEETLRQWCDEDELDLVLTIGGTSPAPGPSAVEVVPQATLAVLERPLLGLVQAMRAHAAVHSTLAWLDCGVSGIRGRSLLFNLPAGAAPALLFLEAIVDLIDPLLATLQDPTTAPRLADELEIDNGGATEGDVVESSPTAPAPTIPQQPGGLNADEFAAFLQRRHASS